MLEAGISYRQETGHKACLNAVEETISCAILAPVNTLFLGNMALWHIIFHANTMLDSVLYLLNRASKCAVLRSPMSMYEGLLSLLLRKATLQTSGTAL